MNPLWVDKTSYPEKFCQNIGQNTDLMLKYMRRFLMPPRNYVVPNHFGQGIQGFAVTPVRINAHE